MSPEELEGLAAWAHDHAWLCSPIDAFDLAAWLECEVRYESGAGGRRSGGFFWIGTRVSVRRLHSVIAHECAHEILARYATDDERSARYLGAALLVPRRALDRQLRAGWDLERLMAEHVNASAELIARRVTEVRRASLAVYDQGRFRYRTGTATPLAIERELVEEALATLRPVRIDDLRGAWPVVAGERCRVLVLAS